MFTQHSSVMAFKALGYIKQIQRKQVEAHKDRIKLIPLYYTNGGFENYRLNLYFQDLLTIAI